MEKGTRQGQRLIQLHKLLVDFKNRVGSIDFVCWEHAFKQPGIANEVHHNLVGVLLNWCEHNQIGYLRVNASTIKKFTTGKGNAKKPEMVAAAKALGYKILDDNEADAIHLLRYVLSVNPELEGSAA